jgi:hypothetical protein
MNEQEIKQRAAELIERFGITEHLPELNPDMAYGLILMASPPYYTDSGDKDDDKRFFDLTTSKKPVTEIRITRGGVEYHFKKDRIILEIFQDAIDEMNHADRYEDHFYPLILEFRPLFNKLNFLSERKRYLFIFELLRLANYPFTKQQLSANDQTKAALIRNWIKRNKNSKKGS